MDVCVGAEQCLIGLQQLVALSLQGLDPFLQLLNGLHLPLLGG